MTRLTEIAAADRPLPGHYDRSRARPASSSRSSSSAAAPYWHPYRGARVMLVRNPDGTFSPTDVIVTLHSAGMLVERHIKAPDEIRTRRFRSEDLAAHSVLAELGLDKSLVV